MGTFKIILASLLLVIFLIYIGIIINKWNRFRREGMMALATIHSIDKINNKMIAQISYQSDIDDRVYTSIKFKPNRYILNQNIVLVTYNKNNPHCCELGDLCKFPTSYMVGNLLLWCLCFTIIFGGISIPFFILGICFFIATIASHIVHHNRVLSRIYKQFGTISQGWVDNIHVKQNRIYMQLHYKTLPQDLCIDIEDTLGSLYEEGKIVSVNYDINDPTNPIINSIDDAKDDTIVSINGIIIKEQIENRKITRVNYKVPAYEYIRNITVKSGAVYHENQVVDVAYLTCNPSDGQIISDAYGGTTHTERKYGVATSMFIVTFTALLMGMLYFISEKNYSDEIILFTIIALSNIFIGLILMIPLRIWNNRYKTNGIKTTATIEQIGVDWPSNLILRYYNDKSAPLMKMITEVQNIHKYNIGDIVDIIYWNKHPEFVVLEGVKPKIQRIVFGIGIFSLCIGVLMVILSFIVY